MAKGSRYLDGQPPGWIGHLRQKILIAPVAGDTATSDDVVAASGNNAAQGSFFDPPLRGILCTGAGTIIFTLDGDDETVAGNKVTKTMAVGDESTIYAIRKVFVASGGTFVGFR